MTLLGAIPTKPFSQAKAELSELMNQVVREHRPTVIERRREAMVALSLDDLRSLLEAFRFEPRVVVGRKEVVASLDEMGVNEIFGVSEHVLYELAGFRKGPLSRRSDRS